MKNARIAVRPLASVECVISLAPTIAALKQKFPGAAVGLVGEEGLREASHLLPELDFFSTEAENVHADFTIDLRAGERLETAAECPDWKAYLQCERGLEVGNPYHLVDLLRKVADVDGVDVNFELALPELGAELPAVFGQPGALRVAVCANSLDQEAIDAVLESLCHLQTPPEIFLLGSVKDRRVSSEAAHRWDGKLSVHDLCGQQSLAASAAVLRACDIALVGPGLHALLSSGFGTFTICVDANPARGPYLYPYGHGHLVIQASARPAAFRPLAAFLREITNHALTANNGNVPSLDQWQAFADSMTPSYLGKIRLLATQRIEILFKDSGSFTDLYQRPLLFAGSEIYDVLQTFHRLLWEHSLSGRAITTYDLEVLHQDTMPILCDLLKPLEQLYELGNFGRIYSGHVRQALQAGDLAKATQESARLQEVEELVHSLAGTQPYLAPLCAYHRERQAAMDAENPLALSDEMAGLFSGLQSRVLVLLDLARSLFHTVFENENSLTKKSIEEGGSDG